ncbi:26755_t:CDS:1, partial [Gigaspora margarita]
WKQLCTSDSTWACYKRESIAEKIKTKRNLSILQALKSIPISTKAWPQKLRVHICTWIKLATIFQPQEVGPGHWRK